MCVVHRITKGFILSYEETDIKLPSTREMLPGQQTFEEVPKNISSKPPLSKQRHLTCFETLKAREGSTAQNSRQVEPVRKKAGTACVEYIQRGHLYVAKKEEPEEKRNYCFRGRNDIYKDRRFRAAGSTKARLEKTT